jgi:hypothetical protein
MISIMNIQPLSLKLEKATLLYVAMFGGRQMEVKDLEVEVRNHAQYPSAVHYTFVERGKRKRGGLVQSSEPTLVVFSGWDLGIHLKDPMGLQDDGSRVTRYASYDPAFRLEFDDAILGYVVRTGIKPVADYRGYNTGYETQNGRGLTLKAWRQLAGVSVETRAQRHAWARDIDPVGWDEQQWVNAGGMYS